VPEQRPYDLLAGAHGCVAAAGGVTGTVAIIAPHSRAAECCMIPVGTMPNSAEIAKVLDALITNGLDFVEKSAGELKDEPKFSIGHFATGLELLLKARLFVEHWALTAAHPHECTWTGMKDGTIVTIQASDICDAVEKITGTDMRNHRKVFEAVFNHRNRTLHWLPSEDVNLVAAEQCRAWYRLHQLLSGLWASQFASHRARIDAVDKSLLVHKEYLTARFEALCNQLKGFQAKGALTCCWACKFNAAVVDYPDDPISTIRCKVCLSSGGAARVPCGEWLLLEDLPCECTCGDFHSKKELLADLDPANHMSPKDASTTGQTTLSCGECLNCQVVVPVPGKSTWVCTECGAHFETKEIGTCEYCNEEWVGYDTSDSAWRGCEFCDGHPDRHLTRPPGTPGTHPQGHQPHQPPGRSSSEVDPEIRTRG
jgi:hypothetical protein